MIHNHTTKPAPEHGAKLKELIADMKRIFSDKTTALGNDRRGRIYIDFHSEGELDKLSSLLQMIDFRKSAESLQVELNDYQNRCGMIHDIGFDYDCAEPSKEWLKDLVDELVDIAKNGVPKLVNHLQPVNDEGEPIDKDGNVIQHEEDRLKAENVEQLGIAFNDSLTKEEPCIFCELHNKNIDLTKLPMQNAIDDKSLVPFIAINIVEEGLKSTGLRARNCSQCGRRLEDNHHE